MKKIQSEYYSKSGAKQFAYFILISTVVLLSILLTFIFFPTSTGEQSNQLLKKLYYADNISSAHQKVIDRFNEVYKGQIQVIPINLPFEKFSTNERKELLARFLRSKSERIDIIAVDQIWVPRFAKWTVSLDKLISDSTKENLLSYALRTCYFGENLYAVPLYLDISVMFYRDDLLKKSNNYSQLKEKLKNTITWQEFISIDNIKSPYFIFQADDYEGLMCIFMEMLKSLEYDFVKDGKIDFTSDETVQALQLLVDLVHKYKIAPESVSTIKENDSYNDFINKDRVFLRGWPNFKRDNKTLLIKKGIFDQIKTVPNPYFQGKKKAAIYGGWNLMISKYSQNIKEASLFIEFASGTEAQKILFEEGGFLPINIKLFSDEDLINNHPELKFYEGLFTSGVYRPSLESYTRISDMLSYYLNKAIKKEISVEAALHNAEKKINAEIKTIK